MLLETVFILIAANLLWFVLKTKSQRKNMPPGPFPLPFIGNVHQIGSNPPFSMKALHDKYGDIYTISTPMGQIVVVNDGKICKEGLVTKGEDFAGRLDQSTFPAGYLADGKDIVLGEYTPALVFRRKIVNSALHVFGEGAKDAERRICHEIDLLLERLEATDCKPFDPKPHLSATTINVITEWLFSKRYDYEDPTIKVILDFTEQMGRFLRQGSLFQIFPILQKLPLSYMKTLKEWRNLRDQYFGGQFAERKETYTDGVVRDITDALIKAFQKEIATNRGNKDIGTIDDCMYLVMDVLVAASDTSKTTVTWVLLYMITFPETQVKAHEELDRVIGRDRQPEFTDAKKLPYLEAIIAETLRFCTLNPIIPRKATCNSSLGGYQIPKGTDVFFSLADINYDPKAWKNPEKFYPDRFLDESGEFLGWNVPNYFPFGAGRRICLGAALGKMQVFLVASRLLQKFTFEMVEEEPRPSLQGISSGVLTPKSFKLRARSRF